MNIENKNTNIHFRGYDARPLKALVMNTNYAGIADDIRRIGEIENFRTLLIEKTPHGFTLKQDNFERSTGHNGAWAQDCWGIVKNTLLARDNLDVKTEFWRNLFRLTKNKTQVKKQNEMGLDNLSNYVDLLYNIPVINKGNKQFVQIRTPDGAEQLIDKTILDSGLKQNIELLKNTSNQCHIKGGNYFLTKGQNGEEELLIGQNELMKFEISELKEMFQTDKVHVIPQADYHIDLFIRPLKDKKVLIADDEMMSNLLNEGFNKIQEMVLSMPQDKRFQYKDVFVNTGTYAQAFKRILQQNPYANTGEIEAALLKGGYEPIRVPGRLFEVYGEKGNFEDSSKYILKPLHNYINATVHINNKGETIYITNKSNLDESLGLTKEIQEKTGFSLEKAFRDAIKPYVDKVYFVSGENNAIAEKLLPEYYGGIHCMTMEVPI